MSQTIQIPNICEFMNRHLVDVFETMLSMKAVSVPDNTVPQFDERVTGCVAFAGEQINGAVYLHLAAPFATQVAAAMLGLTPADLGRGRGQRRRGRSHQHAHRRPQVLAVRFRRRMRREHARHHPRFVLCDRGRSRTCSGNGWCLIATTTALWLKFTSKIG